MCKHLRFVSLSGIVVATIHNVTVKLILGLLTLVAILRIGYLTSVPGHARDFRWFHFFQSFQSFYSLYLLLVFNHVLLTATIHNIAMKVIVALIGFKLIGYDEQLLKGDIGDIMRVFNRICMTNEKFVPSILKSRKAYKPFDFPAFNDRWEMHERCHWLPSEISLHDDINDWNLKLTVGQKFFLENIFKFFTQGDIDVANGYTQHFIPVFKNIEVKMMLISFANRECIHISSYAKLIDSLGLDASTYSEFLKFKTMMDIQDDLGKRHITDTWKFWHRQDLEELLVKIAVFSGFVEGMQLFSSFAMILNFSRKGLMKGMGKIITYSVSDEIQHTRGMIALFHALLTDSISVVRKDVIESKIIQAAKEMVELEHQFIELVFGDSNDILDLTLGDMKKFIIYICNLRLEELGIESAFPEQSDPIPWFFEMVKTHGHSNFFEVRSTDYAAPTISNWESVWATPEDATRQS